MKTAAISLLLLSAGLPSAAGATAGCPDPDAAVHLNQVAFETRSQKLAIIADRTLEPLEWRVVDRSDTVLASGTTRVYGDDPVSGKHVHHADFSGVRESGEGLRLVTDCARSHPFRISDDPFGSLPQDALAYFYHNRSGVPIGALHAGDPELTRPAGHERDTATCRSGPDAQGNVWPGCDYTLDATGGWYDAGDHGKYVVNGGIATWTLLNLHERQRIQSKPPGFPDGATTLPETGNGINDLLDEARFELEFMLAMQAPSGAQAQVPVGIERSRPGLEFTSIDASGMAHHKIADENWTPLPLPPHEDTETRYLYPVSTAATLNLAATAAQCARIWRDIDPVFSNTCLAAARSAYAAARRNPEVYFIATFGGSGMYGDNDVSDEFFWAASELFVTTAEDEYRADLQASAHYRAPIENQPAWPRVASLGLVSLAIVPNALPDDAIAAVRERIVAAASRFRAERSRSGYHIPYASNRYAWGSNSDLLNRALLMALAFDLTGESSFRDAVIDVMDYLLGRNPLDRSYVSGYGERPMRNPHHRFWAPSYDTGLPSPPPGALSGGPNNTAPADEVARSIAGKCPPQTCWRDDVRAYALNEVAINWNAPLVWISAFLAEPPP